MHFQLNGGLEQIVIPHWNPSNYLTPADDICKTKENKIEGEHNTLELYAFKVRITIIHILFMCKIIIQLTQIQVNQKETKLPRHHFSKTMLHSEEIIL